MKSQHITDDQLELILFGALIEQCSEKKVEVKPTDFSNCYKIAKAVKDCDANSVWKFFHERSISKKETLIASLRAELVKRRDEEKWKHLKSKLTFAKCAKDALRMLTEHMDSE